MTTPPHTQGTARWVQIGAGRRLFTQSLPGPDPSPATVVFEAGAGATRSSWGLVQPLVGRFARAVVYDRAGMGRSAPDSVRTLDRMADDLNALLDHLGPGPFVLVGHSAGGPIIRFAASRQPERVRGLVLVDATDEFADVLFGRAFKIGEQAAIGAGRVLARTGLFARAFGWMLDLVPADVRADLRREGFTPQIVRTQAAQARTYLRELEAWRTTPPDTGAIPVTVISGTKTGDGFSAAVRSQANDSHRRRAEASPGGRHVLAPNSGHYVVLHDPEVVADEIRRLVEPHS